MLSLETFKKIGLLGINRRNAGYMILKNKRKYLPLVDNKLKTKQLLEAHGMPTPMLYFEIIHPYELKYLRNIKHLKEFVIKPARGSGGRGIIVIVNRIGDKWKTASGELLTLEDIEYHTSNILAGLYSLGGNDDEAFIEYCVQIDPVFQHVAFQGVPDIRVIVYRGVPAMCMLRLPTKESDGKANLHQGALGVGIDMLNGMTRGGVLKNRFVSKHPDTHVSVEKLKIPYWQDIMTTAAKTYEIFKLGYVGIDFVIDAKLGPLILELNGRPGLNIQLANHSGLLPCLEAIDAHEDEIETLTPEGRLAITRKICEAERTMGQP